LEWRFANIDFWGAKIEVSITLEQVRVDKLDGWIRWPCWRGSQSTLMIVAVLAVSTSVTANTILRIQIGAQRAADTVLCSRQPELCSRLLTQYSWKRHKACKNVTSAVFANTYQANRDVASLTKTYVLDWFIFIKNWMLIYHDQQPNNW
jgi:hypothetical protein